MNFNLRKYYEVFDGLDVSNDENIKKLIFVLSQKNKSGTYKIQDDFLKWIIYINCKYKKPIFREWHINYIVGELNRRQTEYSSIKNNFLSINSKYELADFLDVSYGFLVYVAYKSRKYTIFKIPKKTKGEYRTIYAPNPILEGIQIRLNKIFSILEVPKISSHGFEAGKNIVTNAEKHTHKNYVYNIDLKDFFPSINYGRVYGMFCKYFNLPNDVSALLSQICTYDNILPQGAPTSPVITNIICSRLDTKLKKIAFSFGYSYTRYADDITFSSKNEFINEFKCVVKKIINDEGFYINEKKERIQHKNIRQEVTGLSVNKKVNVKRTYIKNIRAILDNWKKKGLQEASNLYNLKYNRYRRNGIPNFILSLKGRIEFIGLVRGKSDELFLKYKNYFNHLSPKIKILDNSNRTGQNPPEKQQFIDEKRIELEKNIKSCNHNPKNVSKFLKQFSEAGSFKDLVHNVGSFNLEQILGECIKIMEKIPNDKKLPLFLWTHIRKLLIHPYEKIGKMIWEENKSEHPLICVKDISNDKIFKEIKKEYDDLKCYLKIDCNKKYFKDIINTFRKSYKLAATDEEETKISSFLQYLYYNVKYSDNSFKDIFKLNIQDEENIDRHCFFYTDLIRFYKGLERLFEQMIKYKKSNNEEVRITATFRPDDDTIYTEIIIEHVGSKISTNKKPESLIGGDLRYVKNNLWSLCDWKIISKFGDDKIYEVNILPDDNGKSTYKVIEDIDEEIGFKNIFKFYN